MRSTKGELSFDAAERAVRSGDADIVKALRGQGAVHDFSVGAVHGTAATVAGVGLVATGATLARIARVGYAVGGWKGAAIAGIGGGIVAAAGGIASALGFKEVESLGQGLIGGVEGALKTKAGGFLADVAAGAATGATVGAALTWWSGPGALFGSGGGAVLGAVGGGLAHMVGSDDDTPPGYSAEEAQELMKNHTPEMTKALSHVTGQARAGKDVSYEGIMKDLGFAAGTFDESALSPARKEAYANAKKAASAAFRMKDTIGGLSQEMLDERAQAINTLGIKKLNTRMSEAFTSIADRDSSGAANLIKEGMEAAAKDPTKSTELLAALTSGDVEKFNAATGKKASADELESSSKAFFAKSPVMKAMLDAEPDLESALQIPEKEKRLARVEEIYKKTNIGNKNAQQLAQDLVADTDGKAVDTAGLLRRQALIGSQASASEAPSNQALSGAVSEFPKRMAEMVKDLAKLADAVSKMNKS
jgi:hypothetical protein